MTPAPPRPPAPRNFHRAAALYLVEETDFPSRWRRDNTLQSWRYLDAESGNWPRLLGDLAPLAREVTGLLENALAAPLPPFVFRAVGAPLRDTRVRRETAAVDETRSIDFDPRVTAYVDPILVADDLTSCATWDEARGRLVAKYRERFRRRSPHAGARDWDRAQAAPLIGPDQRDVLLKAVSAVDTPEKVLRFLSGEPACAYARPAAPVDVDARAWIAQHLVPAPGCDVGMRWVHEHYARAVTTVAPGVPPLSERRFRPLVEEAGIDVQHRKRGKRALDVALVDSAGRPLVNPAEAPELRLVSRTGT